MTCLWGPPKVSNDPCIESVFFSEVEKTPTPTLLRLTNLEVGSLSQRLPDEDFRSSNRVTDDRLTLPRSGH